MTHTQRITAFAEVVLIVAFMAAIGTPALVGLMNGSGFEPLMENRQPKPLPKTPMNQKELASYPSKFEAFFKDSYGLRTEMIKLHNELQLSLFDHSKSKRVVVGKDGWLFFGDRRTTPYARAEEPLSFERLEIYRKELEGHRDWMASQGIAFVPFIAPIKHAIYPEFVSTLQLPGDRVRRKRQVLAHFAKFSDLQFIDLTPALWAKRHEERLYHKTDTHWNYRGAWIGYKTVMGQCAAIHSSLVSYPDSVLTWRAETTPGLDLARLLRMPQELPEEQFLFDAPGLPTYERIRTELCADCGIPTEAMLVTASVETERPRAVVFGDSFFENLRPFFAPHFSRMVGVGSHRINRALIAHEKPDVVFLEVVERQFMYPRQLLVKRPN